MTKRIVLLRSGRHLSTALQSLQQAYPEAHVAVVAQPGTEGMLDALGIPAERRFMYGARRFFAPVSFIMSAVGRRVLWGRFDRVAVLWADPEGRDHGNVNRTALLLSPRGFLAITPDGRIHARSTRGVLWRETRCAARSAAVAMSIFVLLIVPAFVMRVIKR